MAIVGEANYAARLRLWATRPHSGPVDAAQSAIDRYTARAALALIPPGIVGAQTPASPTSSAAKPA
jgi:hypothetical protein